MSPNLFAGIVAGTILFGLIAIAALVVVAYLSRDQRRLQRRIADPSAPFVDDLGGDGKSMLHGIARQGRAIEQLVDPKGESQRLLVQAGWRNTQSRIGYYAFQALVPVLMAVLVTTGIFLGKGKMFHPPLVYATVVGSFALALLIPRIVLRKVAAARRERIRHEVPLLVHLLVLLFDSGLSTRQALSSLVREGIKVLPELEKEFELIVRQLDAGGDLVTVLRNLEDVLAVEDFSTVLGVLRQADRYGGEIREPLLDTLKVIEERHGLDLREKVNLMSGRMTVVMVLFFFPALLIFTAGPAFMAILKVLGTGQ
ncbi:MAG: type secretion system family protein [Nevskia sp.]|nr:type secretion system family protein [Nevskia sp.]